MMFLAQVDPSTYFTWIKDIGFDTATAAILVIFLIALSWYMLYQANADRKKLFEKVDKLTDLISSSITETTDKSEKRFIDALEKLGNSFKQTCAFSTENVQNFEFAIKELSTIVKTAISILIDKKLNGGNHGP